MDLNSDVLVELQNMTTDDHDRLRFTIIKLFGNRLQNIAYEISPEDILQIVFEKLITGTRKWPKEKVSLTRCIINIIKSEISHLERKIGNKASDQLSDELSSDIFENPLIKGNKNQYDIKNAGVDSVTNHIIRKETQEEILAYVSDDEVLVQMLKIKFESSDMHLKPNIMADALNIKVQDVYSANKRLKTKLKKILQQKGGNCE